MDSEVKLSSFNQEKTPNKLKEVVEFNVPGKNSEREVSQEKETPMEQVSELRATIADASSATLPATVVAQGFPAPLDDAAIVDNTTLTADDADVIEKEWVDRAKKIIAKTKDDPYERENQVGKMQVEYIEKRYGRKIGAADKD